MGVMVRVHNKIGRAFAMLIKPEARKPKSEKGWDLMFFIGGARLSQHGQLCQSGFDDKLASILVGN